MRVIPAYRYLNDGLRLGPLTLGQWFAVAFSALLGLVWFGVLKPLAGAHIAVNAGIGIYVCGAPAAISIASHHLELSVTTTLRAAWRHYTQPRSFVPTDAVTATGYSLHRDIDTDAARARSIGNAEDLDLLFDH
ncbi:hypothetical protein GKE82_23755 [Conexibacter sp. W3-3-2]|uniref:hypothetical protein n=1 Tax=Conexibacter sp. W3-3-2 TaxID=2675227 RepID=UPI0012B6F1D5|nr:hypothetical protein [Conexibacter sp. W3-3-2]MTD47222.1 hypothetical protein [Conexibacter sp. W3-3-2]